MASSVDRRIEGYLSRDMRQRDPAGLIRPRSTEPIRACGQVPRHQAGHMTAIGLRCRHAEKSLRAGGHPHMSRPSTVCRACSTAWRCKSFIHPDGGEGLAKRKAIAWKQWKRGRKRYKELRRRGVDHDLAARTPVAVMVPGGWLLPPPCI